MIIGCFASLIGIAIIIYVFIKRARKLSSENDKTFWAREAEANSVRRKSLDGLNYIHIPLEKFPTDLLSENAEVAECIEIMRSLASLKVVNLTGYSNTDLKLEYGAANITELSDYDQNYTLMARTLQRWADALIEAGHLPEAAVLMEFAISTRTDVSRTYFLLADYWASQGKDAQIERLIRTAESLNSANREFILRRLDEKFPAV